MTLTCPECGAVYPDDRNCQSVFDEFLALEFTDPGYGAVHFLTVTCFMIQHGRYSQEGLGWIEMRLGDHLEKGIPVDRIRLQAAKGVERNARTWKVTRRPEDPPQAKIAWAMTIMDVLQDSHTAGSYCEAVTRWARITLKEMKPLLVRVKGEPQGPKCGIGRARVSPGKEAGYGHWIRPCAHRQPPQAGNGLPKQSSSLP
jgi:hypothetical protein